MGKVLIIGAGGVGTVVAHKVAQNPDVFTEIVLASRTKSKCDTIAKAIDCNRIKTAQVDADNVEELIKLFNEHKPDIVINVALPYQDLTIMDACLACGVNYLDTANYEPVDEAKFEYKWQWAYQEYILLMLQSIILKKCNTLILLIVMQEIMVKHLQLILILRLIYERLLKRENITRMVNGYILSRMKYIKL